MAGRVAAGRAEAGRAEEALDWFARAAAIDADGDTDAAERLQELQGITLEDLDPDADEPEDDEAAPGLP